MNLSYNSQTLTCDLFNYLKMYMAKAMLIYLGIFSLYLFLFTYIKGNDLRFLTKYFNALTLRLVDSHCIANLDRKLDSFKVKAQACWNQRYSWDEKLFPFVITSNDNSFNDMCMKFFDLQPCAITNFWGVKIPHYHDGDMLFQHQNMWGNSRWVECLKNFPRVLGSICLINTV